MSAQPCGCDEAVNWLCERHAGVVAKDEYEGQVQRFGVLVDGEDDFQVASFSAADPVPAPPVPIPRLEELLQNEDWLRASQSAADKFMSQMTVEDVTEGLRAVYPNGHKHYLPVALKQLELHSKKNNDYAAGGDALGNFSRVAAILANYPNLKLSDRRVVALVYALKQIDAVLWGINANITHKVEGLASRLDDIAVYATIVQCMDGETK